MSQDVPCLSLRVKRRRDAEAAPELILETTSSRSAGSVPKLAASLRQTLAVSHSHQFASSAAAEAPAKKRCRFVLVPAADSVAAPTAAAGAAGQEQGLAGPVLELWHTSAAGHSNTAVQHAAPGYRRPKLEPEAEERAGVYDAMVQQYLQEQQQQQQVPTSTQQQHVRHRPSKLAHCNTSRPQSVPPCQQQAQEQQQQHQQGPQLPAYMTAGMLKQYGLWQGLQAQQQQQLQGTVSQPVAAAASTDDSQDMDYAYDMYVAAADPNDDEDYDAGRVASCAGMDSSNCQQEGAGMRPGTPDAAADLPVIQVGVLTAVGCLSACVCWWLTACCSGARHMRPAVPTHTAHRQRCRPCFLLTHALRASALTPRG